MKRSFILLGLAAWSAASSSGCGQQTVALVNVDGTVTGAISSLAVEVTQAGATRSLSYPDPDGNSVALPTSFTVTLGGVDDSDMEICVTARDSAGASLAVGCDTRPIVVGEVNAFSVTLSAVAPGCGNGTLDPGEVCDGTDLGGQDCQGISSTFIGGTLACAGDCTFDLGGCMAAPTCGNSTLDAGEDCDGTNLGAQSCASLGFTGGNLACDTCVYDTSGCFACGNGTAEAGEDCDGTDVAGQDCTTLGLGFVGGALGCQSDCSFDTGACMAPPGCNDGTLDPGEDCDGMNLGGADCASLGFTGGTLACGGGCLYNTSGCFTCGNGVAEATESCDPPDFNGSTCGSLGHSGGSLGCDAMCNFDESACTDCGNGTREPGEVCDGADTGSETCASLGMGGGTLACNGACDGYDTSACTGMVCTPGTQFCDADARTLHTCDSVGGGPDPSMDVTCEYICEADACRFGSNVDPARLAACDGTAPTLQPLPGDTVTVSLMGGTPAVSCPGGCDGTVVSIPAVGIDTQGSGPGAPPLAIFCFADIDIPAGVTVTVAPNISEAIVFIAHGNILVDGDIVFDGFDAAGYNGGSGGPAGGDGGDGDQMMPGGGLGGGDCGPGVSGDDPGGGGGGFGGPGGFGGDNQMGIPGGIGGFPYGTPDLIPIHGGSGGGSGGIGGSFGGAQGSSGGGGGGALHLIARGTIDIGGSVGSRGGGGGMGVLQFGIGRGGGGGGSGGALLLEAPMVSFAVGSALVVDGGDGGPTVMWPGGVGATSTIWSGEDGSTDPANGGGSGGGGGGGYIRVNHSGAAGMCVVATPIPACSEGMLRTTFP